MSSYSTTALLARAEALAKASPGKFLAQWGAPAAAEAAGYTAEFESGDPLPKPGSSGATRARLMQVHTGFNPDALQRTVLEDQHPRKVCVWGRRAGKTLVACDWLKRRSIMLPGSINWYVAPTYKQAHRVAWRLLKSIIPRALLARKPNEASLTFEFRNGSVLSLVGAEDPDSLRGDGLRSVVLDEFAITRYDVWTRVLQPALLDSGGHALFISTPNAMRGAHFHNLWLKVITGQLPGWVGWKRSTGDAAHISPQDLDQARQELRPWEFRQEYEAEFESLSGRVWPEFKESYYESGGSLIACPPPATQLACPKGWQVIVGMDFGWVHPFAAVWIAVGPAGQIMVLAELVSPSMRLSEAARQMRRISLAYGGVGACSFYADPSRPDYIDELTTIHGITTQRAHNSHELGCNRVGQLLGRRQLLVGSCCTSLIRGMLDYSYDPRATVPRVLKVNDDECDALRYAVVSALPPDDAESERVTAGDWEEDAAFVANWASGDEDWKAAL